MSRRKSLLIGINYTGQDHELRGCHKDVENVAEFLYYRGYPSDPRSQVILRDDRSGPFYPDGHNILAAMDWLVSEPRTCCFLHYSGHGGQVPDEDGARESGFDDTIVPVDYQRNGQINAGTLHQHLVSALHPSSTLFIIFDCCHSGSAVELPYLYRTDDDGNLNVIDTFKKGAELFGEASHLLTGDFSFDKVGQARELYSGASSFFSSLKSIGGGEEDDEGFQQEEFGEDKDWEKEKKFVTMFSGCKDDQTSADANIGGVSEGAMSWAFLQTMKSNANPTYIQTLQETRETLKNSHYQQIPQLSCGVEFDLEMPLRL